MAALPWDWSLKTGARFVSGSAPFDWAAALSPPCSQPATAASSQPGGTEHSAAAAARFRAAAATALHTWVHPADAWGPEMCLAARGAEAGLLAKRHEAWAAALRSLYKQQRSGSCAAFYVVLDGCVALFGAPRTAGRAAPWALVSRSSYVLRRRMAQYGLQFDTPLGSADDAGAAAADVAELAELAASRPGRSRMAQVRGELESAADNTAASLLRFEGAGRVHALFNFLHEGLAAPPDSARDVPLLLAPLSFAHASLRPLELVLQRSRRLGAAADARSAEAGGPDGAIVYSASLSGMLPPWCVARLCAVFGEACAGEFEVSFDTLPSSATLNLALPPALPPVASAGGPGPEHSCWDGVPEAAAACEPLGAWADGLCSHLVCREGVLTSTRASDV